MQYDAKQFVDLLQIYKSEETKKSRRNLSTICFVVTSIWFLDINIKDVRLFGVGLENTSEKLVLIVALGLLLYWLVMFLISWFQDKEIQKERRILLGAQVEALISEYTNMKNDRGKSKHYADYAIDNVQFNEVEKAYETYVAQKERTKMAENLLRVIGFLEICVPLIIAIAAGMILFLGLCKQW